MKLVAEQSGHLGGPKPIISRTMASFFQTNPGRPAAAFEQLRGLFLPYKSDPYNPSQYWCLGSQKPYNIYMQVRTNNEVICGLPKFVFKMGHITMLIGKFMIKYVDSFLSGHAPKDHKPLKVIYQHWFPMYVLTSNYNIESMPTKHKVANLAFSIYIFMVARSQRYNYVFHCRMKH
jgi:hypothetical protein